MQLESILGSETRIKILRTLSQDALPQFDAATLAKECGKSVSGIHKALLALLSTRLVTSATAGRTSFYRLNPNHIFFDEIMALLAREQAFENVPHLFPTYWNHLSNLVSDLVTRTDAKAIVLFGSLTRAPIFPISDVDLLLVGPRPFRWPMRLLGHDVQVVAMKPTEVEAKVRAEDPFILSVLEKHVLLYEAPDYEWIWPRMGPVSSPRRRGRRS